MDSKIVTSETIHERMRQWPLFIGLSPSDLMEIAANVRFYFHKHERNSLITKSGQRYTALRMIISGGVVVERKAPDNIYSISEELSTPIIIEPEQLYGRHQKYFGSYIALTDCSSVEIPKTDVLRLTKRYEIVHINLLNIVSTYTQNLQSVIWEIPEADIFSKIIHFVNHRSLCHKGRVRVKITMQQLANIIAESRLNTSKALHALEREGLINMHRNMFEIACYEKFASYKP